MWSYAGFWRRTAASLVDLVALVVATGLVGGIVLDTLLNRVDPGGGSVNFLVAIDWLVLPWLYFSLLESSRLQGTLGKRLLGMVVMDRFGRRISFARATARYFSKYLSYWILGVGFLMVAFTQRKQGLHDMVADTFVLRTRNPTPLPRPDTASGLRTRPGPP